MLTHARRCKDLVRPIALAANAAVLGCTGEALSFAQVSGDVKPEHNYLAEEPDVWGPVLALLLRRYSLKVPNNIWLPLCPCLCTASAVSSTVCRKRFTSSLGTQIPQLRAWMRVSGISCLLQEQ